VILTLRVPRPVERGKVAVPVVHKRGSGRSDDDDDDDGLSPSASPIHLARPQTASFALFLLAFTLSSILPPISPRDTRHSSTTSLLDPPDRTSWHKQFSTSILSTHTSNVR
jgi:hypothetical protein